MELTVSKNQIAQLIIKTTKMEIKVDKLHKLAAQNQRVLKFNSCRKTTIMISQCKMK
jgi:hypothetical protein